MKSVMVISEALDVFQTIHSCFRSSQRVDRAFDKKRALDLLQKKRYDLIFVDLEILVQGIPDQHNNTVLEPFWHLYPSIEIIVMTHQNMLRKAVGIVKAGARDYLSYPIDPVEVKHIIENIVETILHMRAFCLYKLQRIDKRAYAKCLR